MSRILLLDAPHRPNLVRRQPVHVLGTGSYYTDGTETTANHGIRYETYRAIDKLDCLTVLTWYRRITDASAATYPMLIAKTAGGGDEGWYEWFISEDETNNNIVCGWGRWSGGTGTPTSIQRATTSRNTKVPNGRWAHVGFRYDARLGPSANAPDMLLNGGSASGQTTVRTPSATQAIEYASATRQPIWLLGRDTTTSSGNWMIRHTAVWNRYLSLAEVARVYATNPGEVPGGLVFWPDGGIGGPGKISGNVYRTPLYPPINEKRQRLFPVAAAPGIVVPEVPSTELVPEYIPFRRRMLAASASGFGGWAQEAADVAPHLRGLWNDLIFIAYPPNVAAPGSVAPTAPAWVLGAIRSPSFAEYPAAAGRWEADSATIWRNSWAMPVISSTGDFRNGGNVSVLGVATPRFSGTSGVFRNLTQYGSSASDNDVQLAVGESSTNVEFRQYTGAAWNGLVLGAYDIGKRTAYLGVMRDEGTKSMQGFVDGAQVASTSWTARGASSGTLISVGARTEGTSSERNWRGSIDFVAWWGRALSRAEAMRLSANPYALIRKTRSVFPVVGVPWAVKRERVDWRVAAPAGQETVVSGFGATDGNGSTDIVQYKVHKPLESLPVYSVSIWAKPLSYGGGNFGRLVACDAFFLFCGSGSGDKWGVSRSYTTTGASTASNTAIPLNAWTNVGATNDSRFAYNDDPNYHRFFLNGADDGAPTGTTVPSGTPITANTTSYNLYVGNRADLLRNFSGQLAHAAIWNRRLSPAEWRRQYRYGPLSVPDGLVFYDPLDGRTGTVIGARWYSDLRKTTTRRALISAPIADDAPTFYALGVETPPSTFEPNWYFLSSTVGGGWGELQVGGSAPADSTLGTGWRTHSLAAGLYSRMAFGSVRANSTFSGTPEPASGQIVQGNVSSWAGSSSIASKTLAHNNDGDFLLVGVAQGGSDSGAIPSGVTYNGVAMTLVDSVAYADSHAVSLWRLDAPPVGTYDVVVTVGTGSDAWYGGFYVLSLQGVSTGTTLGTPANNSGVISQPTINVTSAGGELVVDVVAARLADTLTDGTPGAGQTEVADALSTGGASGILLLGSREAGATTVTMSWTANGGTPQYWKQVAVSVKAAPGGPDNTLYDCWRSPTTLSGSIAAGDWTVRVPVIAPDANTEGANIRLRLRLWRSTNADGSTPTEITSGAVVGSTVTNLQSEAAQVSEFTFTLGEITLTGEYLFVQIAAETT